MLLAQSKECVDLGGPLYKLPSASTSPEQSAQGHFFLNISKGMIDSVSSENETNIKSFIVSNSFINKLFDIVIRI